MHGRCRPSAICGSICFRGMALWLIFLDHIPTNIVDLVHDPQLRLQRRDRDLHLHLRLHRGLRVRPRDAGARLRGRGARILKRVWQIYVAHIFLFAIYMAEIAYVARASRTRSTRKK